MMLQFAQTCCVSYQDMSCILKDNASTYMLQCAKYKYCWTCVLLSIVYFVGFWESFSTSKK